MDVGVDLFFFIFNDLLGECVFFIFIILRVVGLGVLVFEVGVFY